ncbi:class I glutamine amidotransferase-like protein [Thelephora ganbajun]|uniref:Class I glutamine amidotransferase-like protein n=1 Tax=Thelephora ganbajun TaxID=370292 RepID=A0ACB6ZF58_THEGA|nr:class I glutamine amidotransferase-like protein [Thelephora ganbajun]
MSIPCPTLKLAVCLFPGLTILDFVGPVQVLGTLEPRKIRAGAAFYPMLPPVQVEATYFSHNREHVVGDVGPALVPQRTYEQVLENFEQYDLILVPGGIRAAPDTVDPSLMEFLKKQAPGAKYILTVCTGSWILAGTGLLNGRKATTNKSFFRRVVAATDKSIEWIPQARWVVDGNIWTSSGVTAGIDMSSAFLEFLAGKEFAAFVRGRIELGVRNREDDEFAELHGLV